MSFRDILLLLDEELCQQQIYERVLPYKDRIREEL